MLCSRFGIFVWCKNHIHTHVYLYFIVAQSHCIQSTVLPIDKYNVFYDYINDMLTTIIILGPMLLYLPHTLWIDVYTMMMTTMTMKLTFTMTTTAAISDNNMNSNNSHRKRKTATATKIKPEIIANDIYRI